MIFFFENRWWSFVFSGSFPLQTRPPVQSEWTARARRSLKFCEMQIHSLKRKSRAFPVAAAVRGGGGGGGQGGGGERR
jgi:hypothetical protein